ncbi:MAG: hypothetical protein ACHP6H_02705, partial [Legionellales bacterium]
FMLQAGGFSSNQGREQDINIKFIRGNQYTLNEHNDSNALFGLGYLLAGPEYKPVKTEFGVNAFYLLQTSVNGQIIQEHQFANLAYQYNMTHLPVYALGKATINNASDKLALTFNAGIGPNFIKTSGYKEWAVNGSRTLPDHAFSGTSRAVFSATAGIGVRINQAFGNIPLECGYQFFYLGHGTFNARSDQWLNTLNTGDVYAQALVCGLAI